jgi:hypothetical protein
MLDIYNETYKAVIDFMIVDFYFPLVSLLLCKEEALGPSLFLSP